MALALQFEKLIEKLQPIAIPPDVVLAALVHVLKASPIDQRIAVTIPAGQTLELRLEVPSGKVFIAVAFRMDCEPSEALTVTHFRDGQVIVPPYVCVSGLYREWIEFKGFGLAAREHLSIIVENTSSTDAVLAYEALGVLLPERLYEAVLSRLVGVVRRWLGLKGGATA